MADIPEHAAVRGQIASLADAALCGDWAGGGPDSVLRAMGCSASKARDVPVAMEMIALLQHFAKSHALQGFPSEGAPMALAPGIAWDGSRAVLLLDVAAGSFDEIAYWIGDRLPSAQVKAMPGVLALPFTVESPAAGAMLFPDWFAVFYPHGRPSHAFPVLALQSAMAHEDIGADWVGAALGRMAFYGLPSGPGGPRS